VRKYEHSKYLYETNLEHAKRAHDQVLKAALDFRKSAIESANIAIRAMILINGGAVVALLAFVGALSSADNSKFSINIIDIAISMRWFAFGVGLSATVAALAYLVNMLDADIENTKILSWEHPYSEDREITKWLTKLRVCLHVVAILIAVLTLGVFFYGVFVVTRAMI